MQLAKKTSPIMKPPTKGDAMNALKKLGKAVAYVYAFIFVMLLGFVLLTNAMLHAIG